MEQCENLMYGRRADPSTRIGRLDMVYIRLSDRAESLLVEPSSKMVTTRIHKLSMSSLVEPMQHSFALIATWHEKSQIMNFGLPKKQNSIAKRHQMLLI